MTCDLHASRRSTLRTLVATRRILADHQEQIPARPLAFKRALKVARAKTPELPTTGIDSKALRMHLRNGVRFTYLLAKNQNFFQVHYPAMTAPESLLTMQEGLRLQTAITKLFAVAMCAVTKEMPAHTRLESLRPHRAVMVQTYLAAQRLLRKHASKPSPLSPSKSAALTTMLGICRREIAAFVNDYREGSYPLGWE